MVCALTKMASRSLRRFAIPDWQSCFPVRTHAFHRFASLSNARATPESFHTVSSAEDRYVTPLIVS